MNNIGNFLIQSLHHFIMYCSKTWVKSSGSCVTLTVNCTSGVTKLEFPTWRIARAATMTGCKVLGGTLALVSHLPRNLTHTHNVNLATLCLCVCFYSTWEQAREKDRWKRMRRHGFLLWYLRYGSYVYEPVAYIPLFSSQTLPCILFVCVRFTCLCSLVAVSPRAYRYIPSQPYLHTRKSTLLLMYSYYIVDL